MKINYISINKVKGISNHIFNFELLPNRPTIFVAPNGFGKSSFGIAFDSLHPSKLEVSDKNLYNGKKDTDYSISINYTDNTNNQKTLIADYTKNEIHDIFDVVVINNKLVARAKIADIQGKKIAKPSLEVEKIVLIKTIPKEYNFNYNHKEEKERFQPNQKIVPNINNLFENSSFLNEIINEVAFEKFKQVKNTDKLDSIIQKIKCFQGTAKEIKSSIKTNLYQQNSTGVEELDKLCSILKKYDYPFTKEESDILLTSLQIINIYNKLSTDFRKCCKYIDYKNEKKEYDDMLNSINPVSDRFKLKTSIHKDSLIIEWPKAHQISNGQRDILSFVMLLMKARKDFKKKYCILIIDEIFDYLDDANLITFQYFISEFIESMSQDKKIFPIILTHLDPSFFNHFCFSKKKLQLCYLKENNTKTNKELINLIDKREEKEIKEELDLYFFHYNPNCDGVDLEHKFKVFKLNTDWATPKKFHKKISREVRAYLYDDEKGYDPIAVCLGVRLRIEELAFATLDDAKFRDDFLNNIKGTRNKLSYCEEIGKPIKEVYFLLSIIYNHPLHVKQGTNIEKPLSIKLENEFIKKMIYKIFSETI